MMTLEQLPPKGVKREQAILELGKDEANGELLFQLVNTEKGKCKTAAQKALAQLVEYLKTGPLRLEFPDQKWVKWAELYSFMDVQEMTWKRKKLLSLMVQMDNYSDYLLLWSPRDKKLWYLDIEHEEFHPLAKWDDFIADPGRYLNGMIEGEFEE